MEVKFTSDVAKQSFLSKTDYKLVILIIASRGETYDIFINCWRAYMHMFPEVKSFFLFSDASIDCDVLISEDAIVSKCEECNIPGILIKTYYAMKVCNDTYTYDYMLRTNLSSFYHIPRLLDYLDKQPRTSYVGSQFYILPNVPQKQEEIQFVNTYLEKQLDDKFIFLHGAGFVISNDVAVNYCKEIAKDDAKIKSTFTVADDIGFSLVLYNCLTPADYDDKGFYHPPEFTTLQQYKYQCRELLNPVVYDNHHIFHIRNKKDDSINDNSIECRADDLRNYILQIRYYYKLGNFMEEMDEPEPEFTNDFVSTDDVPETVLMLPVIEEEIATEAVPEPEPEPTQPVAPVKRGRYLVDGFTFYNEFEMLLYRMTVLNDVVDYFVITEATKTFSGKDKPLYYNDNKEKYKDFHHKIIHVIVDGLVVPDISLNEQWKNEEKQRAAIDNGISQLSLRKDDLIIISDVDEIPDPDEMKILKEAPFQIFKVASMRQQFFYYNLNSKMDEIWLHPKIATYEGYVLCECNPQFMRMHKSYNIIDKGGWHLSYFGDAKFIKNKLESFSHQEFNNEEYTNEELLKERMSNFQDILVRPKNNVSKISTKDNKYLPPRYEEFLSNFVLF